MENLYFFLLKNLSKYNSIDKALNDYAKLNKISYKKAKVLYQKEILDKKIVFEDKKIKQILNQNMSNKNSAKINCDSNIQERESLDNIVMMKPRVKSSLTDKDIQALFFGLIKLVKSSCEEKINIDTQKELEFRLNSIISLQQVNKKLKEEIREKDNLIIKLNQQLLQK